MRDMVAGTTRRVSVTSSGQAADAFSEHANISADGRLVAFTSRATNLGSGYSDWEQVRMTG